MTKQEVQLITDNVMSAINTCNYYVLCNLYSHFWLLYKKPLTLQHMGSGCSNTQSFSHKKAFTLENKSVGFSSGEYGGRKRIIEPTPVMSATSE